MRQRVVLLCDMSDTSRLVARALADANALDAILIVGKTRLRDRLRWRLKRHGIMNLTSQLLCALLARALAHMFGRSRRRELLDGLDGPWPADMPRHTAQHVNHRSTIDFLEAQHPDVVVLNGTEIVKATILRATNARFVNIHCGLTPDYRGVHGAFWAMWNRDEERIGVTLHSVDSGVDTGTVISQTRVYPTSRDGFLCLPLLQYRAALPLLIAHLVSGARTGPLPGSSISRQWYHPRLRDFISLLIRRRIPF